MPDRVQQCLPGAGGVISLDGLVLTSTTYKGGKIEGLWRHEACPMTLGHLMGIEQSEPLGRTLEAAMEG